MKPTHLTAALLAAKACPEGLARYHNAFPGRAEVPVTRDNVLAYVEASRRWHAAYPHRRGGFRIGDMRIDLASVLQMWFGPSRGWDAFYDALPDVDVETPEQLADAFMRVYDHADE